MSDDRDDYYNVFADDFDDDYDDEGPENSDCYGCEYLDTNNCANPLRGTCMIDKKPRNLLIDLYCKTKFSLNAIKDYYAYKFGLK